MFKRALVILGLSTLLNAFNVHYDVHMEFKRNKPTEESNNVFIVNGEKVKCKCGKSPSYLLFCYGQNEAFCNRHLPIREVPEMTLEEALVAVETKSTSKGNENGTSEVKK